MLAADAAEGMGTDWVDSVGVVNTDWPSQMVHDNRARKSSL
jgi:hypothetical protein